jgi:cytochrome P450
MYRTAEKPDHVPAERVFDYDMYDIGAEDGDFQAAMLKLTRPGVPALFWTPRNGGHWMSTRGDDIGVILNDAKRFSNGNLRVPKETNPQPPMVPIQVDPPRHVTYRKMLMGAMSPSNVKKLGIGARDLAIELIEGFKQRGECEFVGEFSQILPIAIFMQMVDLPMSDRPQLMRISEAFVRPAYPAARGEAYTALGDYCMEKLRERRANPGQDLISQLGQAKIDGELLDDDTLKGMLVLLLLAGLDTVASMLAFFARFHANHPDHRRQLIEDPSLIPNAVEELLRRHAIVNLGREIAEDTELDGVVLKAGEMIVSPTVIVNMDDARFADAMTVDFKRPRPRHMTFGGGPHNCLGSMLARTELQIYLEEWLTRIPDFAIKPGAAITVDVGATAVIPYLPLVWDVASLPANTAQGQLSRMSL